MFGKNYDISFMRVIGSRAFVHVRRHHEKLDKRAWEGILVGYDNDKPTYRIHNSPIGKIVGFRNVTFIGQVENSTPSSRADDVEERMSSEDPDNLYDGIRNIESNGLDLESSYDDIESKGRAL